MVTRLNEVKGTLKISPSQLGTGSLTVKNGMITGSLAADHVTYSNGTKDYEALENKPALQYGETRKELVGTLSMADFGLKEEALQGLTNTDIDAMIRRIF